jgi:DNA-binding FadR family transcriptional regulator
VARIVKESGQAHRALARAIGAGDRDGTEQAAAAHLDQVEERMLRQLR